jgi:aurora kinase
MCAIKRIPKAIIREENILDQLVREIKIQSYLDHHNITKLYGFFDDNLYLYLVLELALSGQLYTILKDKKRFSMNTTAYIIRQVC